MSRLRDGLCTGADAIFRWLACGLLLFTGAAATAHAHPADEGRVDVVFRVRDGRLTWTVDWWLGNLAGLRFWTSVLDADKDAVLDAKERQAFADLAVSAAAHWPALQLDGKAVAPALDALTIADYSAFISLPGSPQIHAELSAPLPEASEFQLAVRHDAADGLAFTARFPAGGGVRVQDQALARDSYRATVRVSTRTADSAAAQPADATRFLPLVAAGAGLIIAIVSVVAVLSLLRRYRGRDHT